jgi:hypothetical protein
MAAFLFDQGPVILQAPYLSTSSGAITGSGRSYVLIDGGLYSGAVNTTNSAVSSCTSNCVSWVSGSTFPTGLVAICIVTSGPGCTLYQVSSVISSTLLQLTTTPGTATGAAFAATNLVIQNTANGTGKANTKASLGMSFTNLTYSVIRNLTIQNIYVQVSGDTAGAGSQCLVVNNNVTSTSVNHVISGQCKANVVYSLDPSGDCTNAEIAYNTLADHDWGINFGGSASSETCGNLLIHDNDITNWSNWQSSGGCSSPFHQDGVIGFNYGGSAGPFNAVIYNNYIHGDLTNTCPTGFIYAADSMIAAIFNNVLVTTNSASGHNEFGVMWLGQGGGDPHPYGKYMQVWNNTTVSGNSQDSCANFNLTNAGGSDYRNNICVGNTGSFSYDINTYITTVAATAAVFGNFDHNIWAPVVSGKFWGSQANGNTASWATWQGFGFDAHSTTTNPSLTSSYLIPNASSSAYQSGANLASLATGSFSPLTTGAPQFFGITGSCGAGCLARPSSGAWDVGAYPYAFAGAPGAPSGLSATVTP